MNHTIETVSGKFVDVLNPNPDDILIEDIAWALSRISRFAGHTITEIPYNVGQHSIFVASMIQKEHPTNKQLILKGLLHDGAEAYTGDFLTPIKYIESVYPIFSKIEDNLSKIIFSKFCGSDITESEKKIIKHFDKKAISNEAYMFMKSRGVDWKLPELSLVELQQFPKILSSRQTYISFMKVFEQLRVC